MLPVFEDSFLQEGTLKILVFSSINDVDSDGEFHIHKLLLQKHSPYFRALSNFKEGEENLVEFEEMCPIAFNLFANWLYTGTFPDKPASKNIGTLIRAYAIGERLLIPSFKDHIMTTLQKVHRAGILAYPADLETIQNHGLSPTSYIARYFIDSIAYRATAQETNFIPQDRLSPVDADFLSRGGEMVVRLVEKLLQKKKGENEGLAGGADPSFRKCCYYHEHLKLDECGNWR